MADHRQPVEQSFIFWFKNKSRGINYDTVCHLYKKIPRKRIRAGVNSLDAQRLSAENYIKSQQHEGWQMLPKYYNEGGFSGRTLELPALKELFDDIAAGLIDCVIVYKIDRLSRSLLDFTKIVALFDRHNVRLSFAQYERELTSELWQRQLKSGKCSGMKELCERDDVTAKYTQLILRLNF